MEAGPEGGLNQQQKKRPCNKCGIGVKWQLHLNLIIVTALQLPLAITFSTPISSLYLFVTSSVNNTGDNSEEVDWHGLGESDTFYSWIITAHGIGFILSALTVMSVPYLRMFRILMPLSLLIPVTSGIVYANSTKGWMIALAHFLLGVSFGCLEVLLIGYVSVTGSKLHSVGDHQVNKKQHVFSIKDRYLAVTLILRTIGWPIGLGISSIIAQYNQTIDQFRWPGWANAVIVSLYAFFYLTLFRDVRVPGEKRSSYSCSSVKNMTCFVNRQFCKKIKLRNVLVFLYLSYSAHLMASLGSVLGTMVPPFLSDHFGFNITFISYFTLGVMGTSFFGGIILLVLKCLRVNNRLVFAVVLVVGICGTILMSDWQAIGDDPCELESTESDLFQTNNTLQVQQYLNDLCVSQNEDCYWNQESSLTGTFCFLCRSVCRSRSKTINIIQFCISVVSVHLSALIGWTTIVGIGTDCTPIRLQSTIVGVLFATAGVSWLVTPIWCVSVYTTAGKQTFAPLSVWSALQIVSLIGLCALYRDLGPVKSRMTNQQL